jgi:hypothetical protein
MSKKLPAQPSIEYLKNEAKNLLKALKQAQPDAIVLFQQHHPRYAKVAAADLKADQLSLQDCQLAIARQYGFESWPKLTAAVSQTALKATLNQAIRDGDQDAIETLVRQHPVPLQAVLQDINDARYANWFSGDGATMLQLAAFTRPGLAQAMLKTGTAPDLHTACALGDAAAVSRCLAAGQPLDRQVDSYFPIQYTLRHLSNPGNLDALRLLLEHGDDANRPLQKLAWFEWEDQAQAKGLSDWRPIHAVALKGSTQASVKTAALLHHYGAALNVAASPFGETALHLAAIYNGHRLIRWLIENGAEADGGSIDLGHAAAAADLFDMAPFAPFDTHGKTPLMLALGEGQAQAAQALLEMGANINARDSGGFTPLHYAAGCFWDENTALVELALAHGGQAQATDSQGRRPVDLAQEKNYVATVLLLEKAS